jgi:hypothetical protein
MPGSPARSQRPQSPPSGSWGRDQKNRRDRERPQTRPRESYASALADQDEPSLRLHNAYGLRGGPRPESSCDVHNDPCLVRAFIGDYFGLAISDHNIYTLSVSTHYPSTVDADESGKVYYQQQILGTIPRADFGSGF